MRIIAAGHRCYGVPLIELRAKPFGNQWRAAVAWRLAREAAVPQSWIVERLDSKMLSNMGRIVVRFSG